MPDAQVPEVIKVELKHLQDKLDDQNKKLDQIIARQDKANGALGRHDEWIAAKTVEIDHLRIRQDVYAERYDDIQDLKEKMATMSDYPALKEKVEAHQTILDRHHGARRLIADIAAMVAAMAAVAAALIAMVKH